LTVALEWSFNHFGERGAVDVLGWHGPKRSLAVVEVKSRIVDVQDLLGKLDRKVRLARELLPRERGWTAEKVGRILVLPDTSTARDSLARLGRTFDASLPARTVETRRWLRDPREDLESIWFLRATPTGGGPKVQGLSRDPPRLAPGRPSRNTTPGVASRASGEQVPNAVVSRHDRMLRGG
jgi:hypothetical protein